MIKCWICGEKANSEEHKFKASDIKRNYGKKFEAYYISETPKSIKSYKDKNLKFTKVICQNCNNNLTRPHDDAYDNFVKYCETNFNKLNDLKLIDFKEIYGDDWKDQKINLFRYFAKQAGCKIVTSDFPSNTEELANFIKGSEQIESLTLKFELKVFVKDIHEYFNKTHKYVHLFNGPTLYFGKNENELNFGGWLSYNWITTNWVYSKSISSKKRINFQKQYEKLYIKDVDNYQESFKNCKNPQSIITYIEYGKLNSQEKRIDHFKEMII